MACCLTAPSHYLNQCWLIFNKVQWHSFGGNLTRDSWPFSHWNKLENYLSKILFKSPRGQWVNALQATVFYVWLCQNYDNFARTCPSHQDYGVNYDITFSPNKCQLNVYTFKKLHSTNAVHSMWPSDAIWQHKSWSTWCRQAASHYLSQCISEVRWHFPETNFTGSAQDMNL